MGWKVTLKMHNMGEYDGQGNQGKPSNAKTWFKNYNVLVQRISNIAKEFNHTRFIISNEMSNVSNLKSNKTYWKNIINQVKKKGLKVGSSVNMPEISEYDGYQLWEYLDFYGINLYPRLTNRGKEWAKSHPIELANGFYNDTKGRNFATIIENLRKKGKNVWVTEFGCMPSKDGLSNPAYWGSDSVEDQEVQKIYLDAIFPVISRLESVDVMTFWVGNLEDPFGVIGKQAESILKKCWGK